MDPPLPLQHTYASVMNVLAALSRHKYIALTVLVLTMAMVIQAFSTIERYQATTRLSVEGEQAYVRAQLQILTGRDPLLTSQKVSRMFADSFRAIRSSLISKYPGPGTRLLAVTSAQPLEGKTTTATNIALALADSGARVLLIDGDMHRPGLHRPLRLTNERGLSQVLVGQARVRDVIQRTVDPKLLAITAGKTPKNPSELLSAERMKTLLATLAQGAFEWILIDTPAVLTEVDAAILATSVTGVVYVIRAGMTRRRMAERGLQTILSAGAASVAVVLNKVDFDRHKGSRDSHDQYQSRHVA